MTAHPRAIPLKVEIVPSDILGPSSRSDLTDERVIVRVGLPAIRAPRQDPQTVRELDDRVLVIVGCEKVVEPDRGLDRGE